MKRIGIKYQLRIITLIPVLFVALALGFIYNFQYEQQLKQHLLKAGQTYLNQLLPLSQFALKQKHHSVLQTLFNATGANPEIKTIALYNTAGQLINHHGEPPKQNTLKLDSLPEKIHIDQTRNSIRLLSVIPDQPVNTHPLGWLSIEMDDRFLLINRYRVYLSTILITLAALLSGLIIHYYLSRQVYKPIARLRRSMRQILRDEFETNIPTSSAGELGIIERGCAHLQRQYLDTMNDLTHHVEIATTDLQQSLELLEEKNIELSLEKKKIEDNIRQKSELIANMSHEIRTPMNGVIGFTNVLLESKLDTLQQEYVKTIKASAQDLLSIINDILDYSKIDAGKLHLESVPLNIRTCIDEVLSLIAPNTHHKQIDFIPITALNVPKIVLGDPIRVKQIISNLVSNAVKFTDFGYILIRTSLMEEDHQTYTFSLSVTDTGRGISPQDQTALFCAFSQIDTTMTRGVNGSGLGLVICKKLVEHMHGRITVQSELHKGSTFSLTLKLDKFPAYELEKQTQSSAKPLTAICFDENPLHLDALCNGLDYLGVNSIRTHTIEQLIKTLETQKNHQLAFITTPATQEKLITKLIQQHDLMCFLVAKQFIPNYQSMGAHGCLTKPANLQKLQDAVDLVLETYPMPSIPSTWPMTLKPRTPLLALREQLKATESEILLAEDNPVNRMLLESLLNKYVKIDTVEDGEQSVLACQKKRYSVILLDLKMPHLNGLDAARRIHAESLLNKKTPMILISADSIDFTKAELLTANIVDYIQKPIDEQQLLEHLLRIIQPRQTNAIHWPTCLKKVSDNQLLALEFLTQFTTELVHNRQDFITHFEKNELDQLEFLAHKVHGSCCFCGVPELQKQVTEFEQLCTTVKDTHILKPSFDQLILAIDAVLFEYRLLFEDQTQSSKEKS